MQDLRVECKIFKDNVLIFILWVIQILAQELQQLIIFIVVILIHADCVSGIARY